MFVYGPALLLKGDLFSVIWVILTALIGVSALAGAMERWFMGKGASWLQTGILFVSALLLIKPGLTTDLIGFGLLAVLFILWALAKKRGGL